MQNEARIYSKSLEGNKNLTSSFKVKEFACNDGSDVILIHPDLPSVLQNIRNQFGKPIIINSGYRTPEYNKKVGGATRSQHCYGTAADIVVDGVSPTRVAGAAEKALKETGHKGGIGLYKSFVHIDVRTTRYRWDQRSGKELVVGGF
jgi:uncharacterized protein YcbK (DUF882 family)